MGKRFSNPCYERIGELKSKVMNFKRLFDVVNVWFSYIWNIVK